MPLTNDGRFWNCLGEIFSIGVRKLRKLNVLECMHYVMSDSPLTDYFFVEVFQNTSFTKKLRSIKVRGALESVKFNDGWSVQVMVESGKYYQLAGVPNVSEYARIAE